jgi:hypothetical protein
VPRPAGPLLSSPNGDRAARSVRLNQLCRACRAGGDPQRSEWRFLHTLCDPVAYWCACPCDTGELDHRGDPHG